MQYRMMSVRDAMVEAFGRPFFVRAVGEAVRSFQMEVNDPKSALHQNATDYALFEIGVFDDQTGLFECLASPRKIADAASFKTTAP